MDSCVCVSFYNEMADAGNTVESAIRICVVNKTIQFIRANRQNTDFINVCVCG